MQRRVAAATATGTQALAVAGYGLGAATYPKVITAQTAALQSQQLSLSSAPTGFRPAWP